MNIVDPILFQCRRQPSAAAMCVPGPGIGLISYRRLECFINEFSRRLIALGIAERSVVAINIDDVILHTVVLLASMRLGLIAVSLRPGEPALPFKIEALFTDAQATSIDAGRVIWVDLSWVEGDGHPIPTHLLPRSHEDDLCRLLLTSGTSATPKAVPLSHKLVAARSTRLAIFGNRIANCSRIYSDIPFTSSLGFQFLFFTLARGGTVFFPGPDFASTLRVIEDYKVQCVVSSPGGFENLLRWFDKIPAYRSRLEVMVTGGDVLSQSLSVRLRGRLCSHLVSTYGSTEASMSAMANAHEIASVPGAVGFVAPGVQIQIVDSAGTVLPPGKEGTVRIRSEFAADGYFENREESEKAFRDGWFHPGDLGTLSDEGLLVITGREQSVLNLGGDKVSPEAIELVLTEYPAVVEAAAVAIPNPYGNNEVWAILITREKIDENALRSYCDARIARPFAPVKFLYVSDLPRNENGKLDRRRLHESLRNALPPPADSL